MLPKIGLVFDLLQGLLDGKYKQEQKLLEAEVLYLTLQLDNKLAKNILNRCFINLIKRLVLFFPTITPIILDFLELLFLLICHFVFVVLGCIHDNVWKILEQELSQILDVIDLGKTIAVQRVIVLLLLLFLFQVLLLPLHGRLLRLFH